MRSNIDNQVSLESDFMSTKLFWLADKITTQFSLLDLLEKENNFFKGK